MASTSRSMVTLQKLSTAMLLRPLRVARPRWAGVAASHQGAVPHRPHSQSTKPTTTLQIKTPEEAQRDLARQRLNRPVSPHLSIYKWQINSVSSAMERNTGIMLSGSLYLFATAYLASPILGWGDLSSASVAASFGALPLATKVAAKFLMAWPFTFHVFNGVRYLVASTGKTLDNKAQMIRIGWAMTGASVASALVLTCFV